MRGLAALVAFILILGTVGGMDAGLQSIVEGSIWLTVLLILMYKLTTPEKKKRPTREATRDEHKS